MQNIKIVRRNDYASLPQKSTENAVGWDIRACFYEEAKESFSDQKHINNFENYLSEYKIILPPHKPVALSTGLTLELPVDVEMAIKSRSGLFYKYGILAEGTIDPDYRGEIKIMLINLGEVPLEIKHGERIAQAVFRTVHNTDNLFIEYPNVESLSSTNRGIGGFGSTGLK